jgi:hypothetical protein
MLWMVGGCKLWVGGFRPSMDHDEEPGFFPLLPILPMTRYLLVMWFNMVCKAYRDFIRNQSALSAPVEPWSGQWEDVERPYILGRRESIQLQARYHSMIPRKREAWEGTPRCR